ncbi:MAG: hypothetical protein LBS97_01145 [Treponema sp.]|jgi:hypothetical protein|nr:hypothetical protein [Treponema sp.]
MSCTGGFVMNAAVIEFQSVVEDDIIRIPEAYRGTFSAPVVVTVREKRSSRLIPRTGSGPITEANFAALRIKTQGWKFNRDEANER